MGCKIKMPGDKYNKYSHYDFLQPGDSGEIIVGSSEFDSSDYICKLTGGNTDSSTKVISSKDSMYWTSTIFIGPNEKGTLNIDYYTEYNEHNKKSFTMPILKVKSCTATFTPLSIDYPKDSVNNTVTFMIKLQNIDFEGNYTFKDNDVAFKDNYFANNYVSLISSLSSKFSNIGQLKVSNNYKSGMLENDLIPIDYYLFGYPKLRYGTVYVKININSVTSVSVFPNGSQVTAGSTRSDRFIVSNTGSISKILTWINKKFKKLKEYLNRKGEIKWKLVMPSYI